MAIDSLTASLKVTATWNAQQNITGSDYAAISNNTAINKTVSISTGIANASAGGGNELHSAVYSIAGAGNTTIDLTSLTNIVQSTGVTLARVKGIMFRLLSTSDDSVVGTAASSVTIGNAASNAHSLFLDADADTFTLLNGEFLVWGTQSAAGKVVDGSNKNVKILNNDASVTAKVQVTILGATS